MPLFKSLAIPDVIEIMPDKHGDNRGYFSEVYNVDVWSQGGITTRFVQDNHSYSKFAGVLRGLHYQSPPFSQAKLVRVTRGAAFDVAVDIRKGSPTFGKWVAVELSAEKWNQLYIPEGFAHGYLTLTPDVELLYKVSALYSPAHDRSLNHADADLAIDWPVLRRKIILSEKDKIAPWFAQVDTEFEY